MQNKIYLYFICIVLLQMLLHTQFVLADGPVYYSNSYYMLYSLH